MQSSAGHLGRFCAGRHPMACNPEVLRHVPLFALLDDEETAVLAGQVEVKQFAARQRIYKMGEPGGRAYVVVSGMVRVTTVEEDRHDIAILLQRKPMAGMDMLAVLGRQFHSSQKLVRVRAARNPNEVIEEKETFGERVADRVASFGGSWIFIGSFAIVLIAYASLNIGLAARAWDPYPFILLNLFLSMLAAIQAPVIMMSQNRQDKKDRLRGELDYEVNRRAETEIQTLSNKLNLLNEKIDDVGNLLRKDRSSNGE